MKNNIKKILLGGLLSTTFFVGGCSIGEKNQQEWLLGDTVPSNDIGKEGDFYFDTENKKMYYRDNKEWKIVEITPNRDIKSLEKIEIGDEYDTYKITYQDDTTDIIQVKKGDITTEYSDKEFNDKWIIARNNTVNSETVTMYLAGNNESATVSMDRDGIYIKDAINDTHAYIYDEEKSKYIAYEVLEGVKKSRYMDEYSQYTLNQIAFGNPKGTMTFPTIDALNDALFSVFQEGYTVTRENKIIDGEYVIVCNVNGIYIDGGESVTGTYTLKYGDKIHSMVVTYEVEENGSKSSGVNRIDYTYQVDTMVKITDFSSFPEPGE